VPAPDDDARAVEPMGASTAAQGRGTLTGWGEDADDGEFA
jgi:hypothetical protein